MSCEKLFKKIEELNPYYIKMTEDVCNIESPTAYKKGIDECGKYFIKEAEKHGWDIEISKQKDAGDAICITMNSDSKESPICLSGHLDTVHPLGLFGTPAVHTDEEKIYGPGTIDCKGGCVAGFLAMDALSKIGYTKRPVKLILQTDEETSSITSGKKTIDFMCHKAKDSIAFFNLEGRAESNKNKITLLRKGILRLRFNITGKAAHAAKCYDGANAVAEAAYKIIELEKIKNPDGLTCNCAVIEGGTVANTVAEKCSFLVDIRFKNKEEEAEIRKLTKNIANTVYVEGCNCEIEEVSYRPSMEHFDKNFNLLDKVNEILKKHGLETLEYTTANGGSDAAYTTAAGIPTIDSIGVVGGGVHSKNEFVLKDSLMYSAKQTALAIMEL